MQTFKHKEHTIELNHKGEFTTTVDGKLIKRKSLQAMQRFLDTPKAFSPFPCIARRYGGECTAIELHKLRGKYSWNSGYEFELRLNKARDSFSASATTVREKEVLEASDHNRDLLKQIAKLQEEKDRMRERIESEIRGLENQLKVITAADVAAGKYKG